MTRIAIDEKKYEEALEAHEKFFAESKGTSLSAVRTSFGLSNWAELGKVYPPAQKALVEMAAERKNIISRLCKKSINEVTISLILFGLINPT